MNACALSAREEDLPGAGELVQGPFTVEVLHRGDAAGVDVRPQVPPRHQPFQGLGKLLVGVDAESVATSSGRRCTIKRSFAREKVRSRLR
jgi:hypothetical protein